MSTLRNVTVYDEHMRRISPCSKKTAGVLVARKRAYYLNKSKTAIQITVSSLMIKALKRQIIAEAGRGCYICGRLIPPDERATVDHLYPRHIHRNIISGLDVRENMYCCCLECNHHKNDMDIESYLLYRTMILMILLCFKTGQPVTEALERALYGGGNGHQTTGRATTIDFNTD